MTFRRRRRFGHRSVGVLLMIRFLLIANGIILLVIGALYAVYGAKPGGFVVGGFLGGASVLLFCCVPLTDPYRREHQRRR